jgi:glycosyltransferase involved in cell wall biosynthesis
MLPYLQAANVYISASTAEGMPNSLLEAMACGLPALVSDIPGHLEIVEDFYNGRLFSSGNANDLIAKIEWFIANTEEIQRMSANARALVVKEYNISHIANKYRNLILDDIK